MSALHDGDWEVAEASSPSHRSHASGLGPPTCSGTWSGNCGRLPLVERIYQQPGDHQGSVFPRQDVRHVDIGRKR